MLQTIVHLNFIAYFQLSILLHWPVEKPGYFLKNEIKIIFVIKHQQYVHSQAAKNQMCSVKVWWDISSEKCDSKLMICSDDDDTDY